uniref:Methyltransferase n=1 Tax=Mimivirus LCMiAC01 TaxID=2506608 RepID=A0A481Z078_9VIRU|nr:MAG: methyltransferase [Mimivirus LCMiAC01]
MFYPKYIKYKYKYTKLKQEINHAQKGGFYEKQNLYLHQKGGVLTKGNIEQILKIKNSTGSLTLVFGAGNKDGMIDGEMVKDLTRFGKNYVVVTNEPEIIDEEGTPFLLMDFNDRINYYAITNDGGKASLVGRFDKIIIDVSTNKFIHWGITLLSMIRKLLKPGGKIYFDSVVYSYPLLKEGDRYIKQLLKEYAELSLKSKLEFTPARTYKNIYNERDHKLLITEDERHSYNIKILKNSGYTNVQLVDSLKYPYPVNRHPKYPMPTKYYVATNPNPYL